MTGSDRPHASESQIPLEQKFAYAAGMLANNLQAAALPAMIVILNLGLKMDPVLVGLIGSVPRLFDAASDPLIGYLSDRTRSRWGRRRPFIFSGAILSGFLFAAMWQMPEGYSELFYFWGFLVVSVFYFVTYSSFATPFVALGFELTHDYHERTRLQAFAHTVGQLPWIGVPWFYALMASDWFDDKVQGARVLALGVGGAICLFGLTPAVFCREKPLPVAGRTTPDQPTGILHGIAAALSCRPFMKLCIATFLVFNGYQLGAFFTLYVFIYHVFQGNEQTAGDLYGWFGTLTAVSTLAVIPLATWLTTKLGKCETFQMTISLSCLGYLLKWIAYSMDKPYWLLAACPLVAFGIGSLFTLMGSMVADVCDYDELETGQRREGVLGAIYWWMIKLGIALAGFLSGVLLKASGFDVDLATQSEQTLWLLRVFDVSIPLVTSLLAMAIMAGYPINETKAQEIRTELELRQKA